MFLLGKKIENNTIKNSGKLKNSDYFIVFLKLKIDTYS